MTELSAGSPPPPAAARDARGCTILIDFDGTVTLKDSTDALLEQFGRDGWEQIEEDWRAGRIGSRECMQEQVALLDMSRAQLDEFVAGLQVDPGFADFVRLGRRLGCELVIVSDGIDHVIGTVLTQHGLGSLPYLANRLVQVGERSWRLESPHQDPACTAASGTCKCAREAVARGTDAGTILVGDGASDFCVAGRVDLVFAKSRLIAHCRDQGIHHLPITGFAEANELLEPALRSLRAPIAPN